jgi:hypothetical protein
MHNGLKQILSHYKEDDANFNRIVVSLYISSNSIGVINNTLIKSLIVREPESFDSRLKNQSSHFGIHEVIQAFELAIPSKEKTINGAVYTPQNIKEFIIANTISRVRKPSDEILAGDISCGCGAFLYSLAERIHRDTGRSFKEIFQKNIFGLDISQSSIERARILLSLLALTYGEDQYEFTFNLFTANALEFDWFQNSDRLRQNNGFDIVIGNPPYVRVKNLDPESKSLLSKWIVTKSGNQDLYIPFFEIGMKFLNESSILGYITVNSFFKSVNARALRKFFKERLTDLTIIDFGNEKIFGNKSAYTCICLISSTPSDVVKYTKSTSQRLNQVCGNSFDSIAYTSLNSHKGWILSDSITVNNINRIENCGPSLNELYGIKNGIATLKNDIYIFKPIHETNRFYIFEKDGKEYKIEKTICRDIIKPNILKFEHEIEKVKEKLIFPYIKGSDSSVVLLSEESFNRDYPHAYSYLLDYKHNLQERDKGNGDYGSWYAFGRTQALTDNGFKLLFPYMAKEPHFVFTDQRDLLIYCGYAIFSESSEELLTLKKILESQVFDYYIKHTSKPYSGGFFSYAKNYVKHFGVVQLNKREKEFLRNTDDQQEINRFLLRKYQLEL